MNKMKLATLSVFALSAASILASCAGSGKPVSKEDVYLRASAYTINYDGEIKETLYTNDECATIEVENKDSLKYGEQDVVIHVKPKKFFTFRQYNKDDWTAVGSPVRPYVGLGNPVSLYSYPLQENVAWTFEDVSKPIMKEEEFTGFYDEEYKITVKKEYFQKNIVIDYGHIDSLKNHMYVYNSAKYQEILSSKQSLQGDYKDLYQLSGGASSFTAASLGATVIYTFSDEFAPYAMDDWDKPNLQNNGVKNDIVDYKHFKVEGVDSKGNKTNLATFDTSKSEKDQNFMVSVFRDIDTGRQYIEFFIKWDLLAKGPEDGYEPLYNDIQVTFDRPTITCVDTPEVDEGITKYPGDFFMYPSATDTTSYKPVANDESFKTYDSSGSLNFEHIYTNDPEAVDPSSHISYSALFKLEENKKDFFSISIDGIKAFNVDLRYGKALSTGWRIKKYNPGIKGGEDNGERELKYWEYNNVKEGYFWTLVQLNPNERTYGLPEDLQGKENLYYLYSLNSFKDKASLDIKINYEKEPTLSTFTLSETSTTYGALETTEVVYPCGDDNSVDVKFIPNKEYATTNFNVKVSDKKLEPLDVKATYSSDGSTGTIHIESNAPFGENTFVIDLSIAKTKVTLSNATTFPNRLGWLVNDGKPVDSYDLDITAETKQLDFTFLFDESKYSPDLSNPEADNEWDISVYYNNTLIENVVKTVSESGKVSLSVPIEGWEVKPDGDLFKVEAKYLQFNYKGDSVSSFVKLENQPYFWHYVGKRQQEGFSTISFMVTFYDVQEEVYAECNSPIVEDVEIQPNYEGDPSKAMLIVHFDNYSNPIPDGEVINLNIITKN